MYRGFIKKVSNLGGLALGSADLRVLSFSINRDILTKATSEFTVVKIPEEAMIGYVFGMYDDYGTIVYLGRITELEGNQITTDQIVSLFDDNWLWNNPNLTTIEQTVVSILNTDFVNSNDSLVKDIFSQFNISIDSTGTQLALPSQDDNYVENFMSFIFDLYENYGLLVDINISYNAVNPSIVIKKPNYPILKLGNNNENLVNFNIQRDIYETNKLIVYKNDGTYVGTWYGSEDGITQDDTSVYRLPKINTNIVFSDDDIDDILADNLSEEMYNHKITLDLILNNKLYDFNDFNLGQEFIIYYNDEIYSSILTGYSISMSDSGLADRVSLVFGKVRNLLTDKINRLIKGTAAFDSAAFIKKSGGTVSGDLTLNSDLGLTDNQEINLYDSSGTIINTMTTNDLFSGTIPIATENQIGGVLSGGDISVDSSTGEMTIPVDNYNYTGLGRGWYFKKSGNVVHFFTTGAIYGTGSTGLKELFTLPEELRPSLVQTYHFHVPGATTNSVRVFIQPTGVVQAYMYGSVSTSNTINVIPIGTYIVD